jgi:hypothetical protein
LRAKALTWTVVRFSGASSNICKPFLILNIKKGIRIMVT